MKFKKALVIGLASIALLGGTFVVNNQPNKTVQAATYKYTGKWYKVKILNKIEVDKYKRPTVHVGDIVSAVRCLEPGQTAYIKSLGKAYTWRVKARGLSGNYWQALNSTRDYSWFSTNMRAALPSTYSRNGVTVRTEKDSITVSNKQGKLTVYTTGIKLYHLKSYGGDPENDAFIKAKFTNKTRSPRTAIRFATDHMWIRKINSATYSNFYPDESVSCFPSKSVDKAVSRGFAAVRPGKTVKFTLAGHFSSLKSYSKFVLCGTDYYHHQIGRSKYATGGLLVDAIHYLDVDDFR